MKKFLFIISFINFIYFIPGSSANQSLVKGQYYLRGICPSGDKFCGTGYDLGILNTFSPLMDEERNCDSWIQFNFRLDKNPPTNSTNIINKIYYHIWWRTNNGKGEIGYYVSENTNAKLHQSFSVHRDNAVKVVDSYYLTIMEQNVISNFRYFNGSEINNLKIKLKESLQQPSIISSPKFPSFIIINPASPDTLANRDSDSDGLNDFIELYQTFTDPQCEDTDSDGMNDYFEFIQGLGLDPNDSQDPPEFGKRNMIEVRGNIEQAKLGTSVKVISDTNNDGFKDIAVGEPGTGSVHIYDHHFNLIRIVNGSSTDEGFGSSIAEILDPSGQMQFLIVGAPDWYSGTGRIYFFSPHGELDSIHAGSTSGMYFGATLCSIGDQNGDDFQDLVVGAPSYFFSPQPGRVFIISGYDKSIIATYSSTMPGDQFGFSLSPFPDSVSDEDSFEELLIGAPYDSSNGKCTGALYLYSSTGNVINMWLGEYKSMLGYSVCSIQDQDNDCQIDIAVSKTNGLYLDPFATSNSTTLFSPGSIVLISGRDYQHITTLQAGTPGDQCGLSLKPIKDVDGDGRVDLVVSTARHRSWRPSVAVITAGHGLFWRYTQDYSEDIPGTVIDIFEDINGDGISEIILGSPDYHGTSGVSQAGSVSILTLHETIPDYFSIYNLPFSYWDYFHEPDNQPMTYSIINFGSNEEETTLAIMARDPYGQQVMSNIFIEYSDQIPDLPSQY